MQRKEENVPIENTEFLFRKEESVDIFDGSKVVTEISLSKTIANR